MTRPSARNTPRRGSAQHNELIYSLRRQLGIDQPTMAVLTGLSLSSICRWEQGGAQMSDNAATQFAVLLRAVERVGAVAVLRRLHELSSSDKVTRLIALVHLGDEPARATARDLVAA